MRHALFAVSHRNTSWVDQLHQQVHQPSLKPTANNQQQPHTRFESIRFIYADALHQSHASTNPHEQVLPALAARRSGVRSPSAPLLEVAFLSGMRGNRKAPSAKRGALTPPRYTNASSIAATALRQDVRVDIERDSYAGVSQVSGARFMPIAPQSDLEDDQHPVDQEGVGVGSDLRRDPASQPHKVLANDVSLWLHPITTSKGEQPGVLLSSTHHPNHFSRVGRDQSCGCVNRAR